MIQTRTRKKAAEVDAVQMASAEIGNKPPQAPEVEEAEEEAEAAE